MDNIINIFNESSKKTLPRKKIIEALEKIISDENINNVSVNVIFADNKIIKKINQKYLNHNYATDVISFKLEDEPLEGEIYISVDIARTNALEYKASWTEELTRYAIHGFLHLLGYEDFSLNDKEKMRKLEDKYLQQK
jgi:rRNA maturation RNase YbeY